MRRMLLNMLGVGGDKVGLKYKTGEFVGNALTEITIEHGLGEVPFLFAFVSDVTGEETVGTVAGMFMNTGLTTRYTSTVSKEWWDVGNTVYTDGINKVSSQNPSSIAYGVQSVDESQIRITAYANKNVFISGKVYKWIAIADWRS